MQYLTWYDGVESLPTVPHKGLLFHENLTVVGSHVAERSSTLSQE